MRLGEVGRFDVVPLELSEDGEPTVHLGAGVGSRVNVFGTEYFQDVYGAPTIFRGSYLFEVIHAVVEDVAIFVVDFLEGVMPFANPRFVNEDVTVDFRKMAHLRITAATFAVVTVPSRNTQSRAK